MKNYFLHFGIWLGGVYVLLHILGMAGLLGEVMMIFPYFDIPLLIIGMILAIVMTHKAEGGRIKFGKAFLAGLTVIFAFFLIGVFLSILRNGTEYLSFFLEMQLVGLGIKILVLLSILLYTGMWYMVEKANQPGWALLIPIYNIIILLKVAQKPLWYLAMFFLPIANIVFMIMMLDGISKSFGKSSGFTVGLVFLGQIFYAILGYGDAEYLPENRKPNEEVLDL